MADPTDAESGQDGQGSDKESWSSVRKSLEDRAKAAEEKAAAAERKLAFTEAGLNSLTDMQVKALGATHEGEITPDALRATAKALGFVSDEATGQSTPAAPPEPDRSAEAAQLAQLAGSPANLGGPVDPSAAAAKSIQDFQGDWQQFQDFVLANADKILPPG